KWDLADKEAERVLKIYRDAGYACICTEATAKPVESQKAILDLDFDRTYIMGPSGVGKTSLMNAILPDCAAATGAVNEVTGKGRHTTTHIEFRELPDDRLLADTPGLGLLHNLGVEPHNLRNYYREFLSPAEECKYRGCMHQNEPQCAVKELVGARIHEERYESYLLFLDELMAEDEQRSLRSSKTR
ncbi:MAG: ribosome small subunit-dependent GTPase A, partial [Planctomycetes bacterium]|nr:ribosome small subunit-dependent GTPase A [Planctomycetota bacterium]